MSIDTSKACTDFHITEHLFSFQGFEYCVRVVPSREPVTVPIVMLGGSSQDRHTWPRHEERLTLAGTVITVDLPGYGTSDFLPSEFGLDFLADALHHALDSLGHPSVNLMGACYGGAVALRFTQRYATAVRRLCLAGMILEVPEYYVKAVSRWTDMLGRGDRAAVAHDLVDLFTSPPTTGPVRKHKVMSRILFKQFMDRTDQGVRMDLEHSARLLRHGMYVEGSLPDIPCLVFTGEHDVLTPPHQGRKVAALFPRAQFTTIKETDHLCGLERVEETAELWARFFSGQPYDDLDFFHPLEG
ncbi:alpha/beta fold hydrolase [Streptomyces sp. NPDC090442]|uniref:alpha/beta fold hydrolase n=1 Tax=Streptomyces sp. NPDC090442 TaxID=3365962 RepID=UPI00381D8D54